MTGISWTDETWNPVRGCSRVSEGCRHCYAEVMAARIVRMGKGKPTAYDGLVKTVNGEPRWTGKVAFDVDKLSAPLRWRKSGSAASRSARARAASPAASSNCPTSTAYSTPHSL